MSGKGRGEDRCFTVPTSEVLRNPSTYLAFAGTATSIKVTHAHTHAPQDHTTLRNEPRVGRASCHELSLSVLMCPAWPWEPMRHGAILAGCTWGGAGRAGAHARSIQQTPYDVLAAPGRTQQV